VDSLRDRVARAKAFFERAGKVVAFTGAGISTESGIADFRSPGGVWARHRIVTYQEFLESPGARVEYWRMKRELFGEMKGARPNRAHLALAALERAGRLACLITQNIDGLHQEAGNSPGLVIELHGTNRQALCLGCQRRWPIEDIQARLDAGDLSPSCENCGGLIKPATISFGQSMPVEALRRAYECATSCDLFLMVGSSLQVEPAASLPRAAHGAGSRLIFVNRTETPWDHIADLIFRENAGEVLSAMVEGVGQRP